MPFTPCQLCKSIFNRTITEEKHGTGCVGRLFKEVVRSAYHQIYFIWFCALQNEAMVMHCAHNLPCARFCVLPVKQNEQGIVVSTQIDELYTS